LTAAAFVEQVGAIITAEGALALLGRRIFRHSSRLQRIWKLPEQVDGLSTSIRSVDAKVDGIRTAFDSRLRIDEERLYGRGPQWLGDGR
jgi:hypothetical protein